MGTSNVACMSLSHMQQSMLYSYFAYPDSYCNFEMQHFYVRGVLDEYLLELAWQWVLYSHSILGTRVCWDSSKVYLTPAEQLPKIEFVYLHGDHEHSQIIEKYSHRRIDLTKQVMEITMLINGTKSCADMIILSHHLVYDGWSTGILIRDFIRIYRNLLSGKKVPKPNPEFSHQKFIDYQMDIPSSACDDFYLHYLDGFHPYTMRTHSFNMGYDSKKRSRYNMWPISIQTLSEIGKRIQTTSAVVMIAVWGLELLRRSGKDDIIVGVVFSGRTVPIPQIENAVGPFVNVLPVRIQLGSIYSIISSVHIAMVHLHAFQNIPMFKLSEANQIYFSKMESIVVFQNYFIDESVINADNEQFIIKYIDSIYYPNNYITLEIKLIEENVHMELCYDCDEYTTKTVNEMSENIKAELVDLYHEGKNGHKSN